MIRKAVILAAGKGTRMLPLTEDKPKPLIKVAGKPFLYYIINNLTKAGYNRIAIVVSYKKEKIKQFLEKYNFKAELIDQKKPLGTAHAIKILEKFVDGNDFIVTMGDNLFSVNDFKKINIEDKFHYVVGYHHPTPSKFGVLVKGEDNFLKKIVEKPKRYVGDIINTALYKFTPEIFDELKEIKKSQRGEYEITDAISNLAEQKKVKVLTIHDYWLDLGCKEDIPKVENFIINNFKKIDKE